ncbi:MAG: tetratricopeptide repeat protein [Pontixanthobacter sp.]
MTDPFTTSLRLTWLTAAASAALLLSACSDQPSDPFSAALQSSEKGDFQAAKVQLVQALEMDPANGEAILLLGKTLLSLENPEGAAEQFKKLTDNPKYAGEANALLAKAYLQSGNTKLALEKLDSSGMSSGLSYAVGVVAQLSEGYAEKAVNLLDQGLAKFPDSADLLVLNAKRAYDVRDIAKARGLLQRVLEERPNMIEARLLAGRLEMHERKLDLAKEHFAQVIKSSPWNLPAILSMAAIARDESDEKAAGEWLAKAKEIAPGHPVAVYFAAQMAFDAGNIDDAHMLVQSAGNKDLEFPALRMLRGLIAAKQGQTYTAISEFERYFRLGGDNSTARVILAKQYVGTNSPKKAWDILAPVLSSANADVGVLTLGAQIAGKLGKPEQAQLASRAQAAKAKAPYAPDMVKAGGFIRAGNWKDADALYSKVLKNGGGSNPVVLNNASVVRLKLGDKQGALTLARKAFALAPNDPIIMDTLGWSLIQTDPASAEGRSLIQRALQLAPGNEEIADHYIAIS